jgi:SAM-dependent methyltransferase
MDHTMDSLRGWITAKPADVITEVSPNDNMHTRSPRWYARAGQVALQQLKLTMLAAGKDRVERALDFGCGHGRVLRSFRAAFPDTQLTACDINRDAVDFCARVFGATPVYSSTDPAEIAIDGTFDLIWCNSFFTHVDRPGWDRFLPYLAGLLEPGGLFIFTTAGRRSVRRLREEPERWPLGWMRRDEGLRDAFLAEFDRDGFAHRDSPAYEGWGFTAAGAPWVCRRLAETTDLRLLGLAESKNVDTFSTLRPV